MHSLFWPFPGLRRRHYRALLIDFPWKFTGGTKSRPQHYRRMTDAEIAALPIRELCHPDGAWVFVWCTAPKADALFRVIAPALGLTFSSRAFLWAKLNKRQWRKYAAAIARGEEPSFKRSDFFKGTGLTTRKNPEDCWLFKIGEPELTGADVDELIITPRREHSRKPDEARDSIVKLCNGPYAELYSRGDDKRFHHFGDEAGKFTTERTAA